MGILLGHMKITVGGYAALGIGEVEPLDLTQSGPRRVRLHLKQSISLHMLDRGTHLEALDYHAHPSIPSLICSHFDSHVDRSGTGSELLHQIRPVYTTTVILGFALKRIQKVRIRRSDLRLLAARVIDLQTECTQGFRTARISPENLLPLF